MQVAFICVVKAVLPVDLFEVLPKNWFVSEHHLTVVTAVWFISAVQV